MAMTKEEQQAAWNKRKKRKALITSVEESGLTKEKYEQLKSENLSDGKIIEKFPGLYPTKLYNWKKAVGLLDAPAETAEKPAGKLDDDTKSKLSGLKGKLNSPKTSQEPQEESVENKTATSQRKEEEGVSVDSGELQKALQRMTAKVEQLEGKLKRADEKNAELAAENDRLHKAKPAEPDLSVVDEMKAENKRFRKSMLVAAADLELAQSEIRNLTEQVRELQRYKADYTALEQLHRETRARLHAAEEENAALTGTETEHIQLMRRHVQLYDRMQGVYAE